MKVSISSKIVEGPWGGGNLFIKNLSQYLKLNGVDVVHDLFSKDIDVILLIDPRKDSFATVYGHKEIINYQKYINNDVLVVQRFNECDQRKNTKGLNEFLKTANECSDVNIFVSNWLLEVFKKEGLQNKQNKVIMTGAQQNIFNSEGYKKWDKESKIKAVTHHWGNNVNKGFEIYSLLDKLLDTKYSDLLEFTYVGNIPKELKFKNTNYIPPTHGKELAQILKNNHFYITASKNEPSGNHHIEAAQCGLPILYLDSGGIPEFCDGFGISFNEENFQEKLDEMINKYYFFEAKMVEYPFNSDLMCKEYLDEFYRILKIKKKLINNRVHNRKTEFVQNKYLFLIKLNSLKLVNKNIYFSKIYMLMKRLILKIKSTMLGL